MRKKTTLEEMCHEVAFKRNLLWPAPVGEPGLRGLNSAQKGSPIPVIEVGRKTGLPPHFGSDTLHVIIRYLMMGGYLIASRSPPSHDPKLLSFLRICPLPGTHFYHFGLLFGVTFASLGPLLEHFGYIF